MDKLISVAARLLMAQMFIISGWQKLIGFSGAEGYFASLGIPLVSVVTPLVILIELGGDHRIVHRGLGTDRAHEFC